MIRQVDKRRLEEELLEPTYAARAMSAPIPKYRFPTKECPPEVAQRLVEDELMLDGNSRLNLATFVTTWMEPQARELMSACFDKNMIDKDEYPRTAAIEARCVNMLAHLWNAPAGGAGRGCSTVGSSEAAMLGGLALKWKWRERRRAMGKKTDAPNMVMGINVQVCWEKFCRYWDVTPRLVPLRGERYRLGPEEAVALCDENTIGVVAVMGSTFTGEYEPVKAICAALDDLEARTGLDVPVHVDAASGGFVAPFLQPDLEWDFRLPRVKSINASGHKYGLVYPGVGWALWRDREELPEELVFKVNYLGGEMPTFALNFSRPGAQVAAQYYNFLRLGREGYRRIQAACRDTALHLSERIDRLGPFQCITRGEDIPVFAFRLKDPSRYTVFDVSEMARDRGWLIPAYAMPPEREDVAALRIVIKEGFSREMADMLLEDLSRIVKRFGKAPTRPPDGAARPARSRPRC